MELFREVLNKTLDTKREELLAFKKHTSSTETDIDTEVEQDASKRTTIASVFPPLDYSVSKVVKSLRTFEVERQKKSKRAIAEKALKDSET